LFNEFCRDNLGSTQKDKISISTIASESMALNTLKKFNYFTSMGIRYKIISINIFILLLYSQNILKIKIIIYHVTK